MNHWDDKRVSYSGYYAAFPRLRGEFDSLYPHQNRINILLKLKYQSATIIRTCQLPKTIFKIG